MGIRSIESAHHRGQLIEVLRNSRIVEATTGGDFGFH